MDRGAGGPEGFMPAPRSPGRPGDLETDFARVGVREEVQELRLGAADLVDLKYRGLKPSLREGP